MITPTQIKLIHVGKSKLGMGDAEYRALLHDNFDALSSKDLTYAQASALIDEFKARGFTIRHSREGGNPRSAGPNVETMLTPGHPMHGKLSRMKEEVHWRHPNGYYGLIKRVLKGKDKILTTRDAAKVIEALKGMVAGQRKRDPLTMPDSEFRQAVGEMKKGGFETRHYNERGGDPF